MTRGSTNPPRDTPPGDTPSGTTELYETTSIRFVILEIGKLTAKVDRLIVDVDGVSKKASAIDAKISRFEGIVVGGFAVLFFALWIFWWAMGDHIKAAVDNAFRPTYSSPAAQTQTPQPTPTAFPGK